MAIVTFAAPDQDTILNENWLKKLHSALQVRAVSWLAPDEACDVDISGRASDVRVVIEQIIADAPIDCFVHEDGVVRRKQLLLADMESTIIEQEMLDEMADVIGARDKVADITCRAMNGEIDFVAALKERVALFKGQPESLLTNMAKRITEMPGARTLVATMNKHGAQCWLVSGGFRVFTKLVARQLGFAREFGNELAVEQGRLAGTVHDPVLDRHAKLALLHEAICKLGIGMPEAITVGDGANDLPMLEATNIGGGLGVAYRAKPSVNQKALYRVRHCDLTALLYAQGYCMADFAA